MSATLTAFDDGQQSTPFDYTTVPAEVAHQLQMSAERVRMRMERTVEDIIEIGRELKTAQRSLANHHGGTFVSWIQSEFEMSHQTAYKMMRVAEQFGDGFKPGLKLPVNAFYLLAAPSTPESVREAARKGELMTTKDVEQAIARAKEAERLAKAEADLLQERLQMAEDEVQTRERQQREAQQLIDSLSDRIRDLETKAHQAEQAKRRTPTTKEVRVEVPVIPPEKEQELADLKQQLAELQKKHRTLAEHAYALQQQAQTAAQRETGGQNARQIRLKWYSTRNAAANALRKLLADLPLPADTEQFDADDWQGLAELLAMTERVSDELRTLQHSPVMIVEG